MALIGFNGWPCGPTDKRRTTMSTEPKQLLKENQQKLAQLKEYL
jgi:hypothetical protein